MHRSFVKQFFITSAIFISLLVIFTLIIDPFARFQTPLIKHVNEKKFYTANRFCKAMDIIKKKPTTVLFGTSRMMAGFSDEDVQKITKDSNTFNSGFEGANFDEMYAYFLHALYVQPNIKTVIIGIDLLSFGNRKPASDFNEDYLQKTMMSWTDICFSLLSYYALSHSYRTFVKNYLNDIPPPKANKRDMLVAEDILVANEDNFLKNNVKSVKWYANYSVSKEKIRKFQHIANLCQERSITLKVLITPIKAKYWKMYYDNGLWDHLEDLKRQLCAIHPLWDFSGYTPITTETIDSHGEAIYYDVSHFAPFVGKILLEQMFQEPPQDNALGVFLTPNTIEGHLKNIRMKMASEENRI